MYWYSWSSPRGYEEWMRGGGGVKGGIVLNVFAV